MINDLIIMFEKNYRSKEYRLKDSINKDSRLKYSRQNDTQLSEQRKKNNMIDSQVFEVCNLEISEKINQQQSFQMLQSHYRTRQVQQQKLKHCSSNIHIKFGDIIQVKKQIIHDPKKVLNPFNNDQNGQIKLELKKFMNSKKALCLMDVLSQRTAKKGIQDYLIEKDKKKLIQNLNLRIKRQQNEDITIMKKLQKQDEELGSYSQKNYEEKQKMKFRNENASFLEYGSSNNQLLHRFSQQRSDPSNLQRLLSGEIRSSAENLVNLEDYDKFFDDFNDNSLKKSCLRNKSLILVNQDMEIGCMSVKKDKFININFFMTSKIVNLKNLKFTTEPNQNLGISFFPDSLYSINAKKQQALNIIICVQNIPYALPKLRIQYQMESVTKAPQKINKSTIQLILPCAFNKLCSFQSINVKNFYNMFNSGDSKNDIKCCRKFKLNSRVFNEQKIKEFFPYLTLLKKIKHNNSSKSRIHYGFQANYNGNVFLVVLKIEDEKYVKLEAKNMTGQKKTDKYVKFFMATLKNLIGH